MISRSRYITYKLKQSMAFHIYLLKEKENNQQFYDLLQERMSLKIIKNKRPLILPYHSVHFLGGSKQESHLCLCTNVYT